MDNEEDVKEYLKLNTGFEEVEVLEKFTGGNNDNFVFESESGKHVLRAKREDRETGGLLKQERKMLKFMNEEGIEFVPRSVYYDEEVHVVEYVGEENVGLEDLERAEIEEWVEKVVKLHSLEFQDFVEFCEKRGYDYSQPETPEEELEKFGVERLEYAKEHLGDHELVEWVEEKLENAREEYGEGRDRIGLAHGDIANNTRRGDELYFIDWEFGRFVRQPEGVLSYVFIHEEPGEEVFDKLKQLYSQKTGIEDLEDVLLEEERATRICDVIWALMRAAEEKKCGSSRVDKYLDLVRERKQKYEERF